MKIIAKVRDGYNPVLLAEVTTEEFGLITMGAESEIPRGGFTVGSVIQVGRHWERVKDIELAQKKLDNAAQSIRAVADLLGTIDVVVPPTPEPTQGGAK